MLLISSQVQFSCGNLAASNLPEHEPLAAGGALPKIEIDQRLVEVAKTAGLHRRDYGPSHGTGLADGMLTATADLHALELRTLNTRHYPMFQGLRAPYVRPSP